MLRHQFGQHLVLDLDLLGQIVDPFLVGGAVAAGLGCKGRGPVLEKLLLPTVKDGRLESQFIAELRDRLLFQQMAPQDGDLLFGGVVLSYFFHAFSPVILTAERSLHFQLRRNNNGVSRFCCEVDEPCLVPWKGMPITPTNPFKGRHFPGEVIVQCVRWYLQYPLAYEHVSQLMAERGVPVDPSCIWAFAALLGV